MTFFDEARSIKAMLDVKNMTQARLAEVLGVSQSYIANKIRLLSFSKEAEERITSANLSERHARALLRLGSNADILSAIDKVITGKMNVLRTETLVDIMLEEIAVRKLSESGEGERVARFENIIETSVGNLRAFGIKARAEFLRENEKLYINILIG